MIQSLVGGVRSDDNPAAIKEFLNDICVIIDKVVGETQHTANSGSDIALQERVDPLVNGLAASRTRLADASAEGESIRDPIPWKEFTKKLPPLAFEVARQTKELVQRLEWIEDQVENGTDFR